MAGNLSTIANETSRGKLREIASCRIKEKDQMKRKSRSPLK